MIFDVEATTGSKAVAEARHQAKACGMQFIQINSVTPAEKTVIRYSSEYGAPLTTLGGSYSPPDTGIIYSGEASIGEQEMLSLDEINDRIGTVWGRMVVLVPKPDEPPLKAYEQGGRVFLDDGVSGRQELLWRSPMELVSMAPRNWATGAPESCPTCPMTGGRRQVE